MRNGVTYDMNTANIGKTFDVESFIKRNASVAVSPQEICTEQPSYYPPPLWNNQPNEAEKDEVFDDGEQALLSMPYDRRFTLTDEFNNQESY